MGLSSNSEPGSDPVRVGLLLMANDRSPEVPLGNEMEVNFELEASRERPIMRAEEDVPRIGSSRLPERPVLARLSSIIVETA